MQACAARAASRQAAGLEGRDEKLLHRALGRESMESIYRWSSDHLLPFIMTAPETPTAICWSYVERCICAQRPTEAHLDHVTLLPGLVIARE